MGEKLAYSIDEAAAAISIHKATVRQLIKDGQLTTFKLGRRTLIRADVLRQYVDKLSRAA